MLQQKLELLSYSGVSQKAAFWLLMQARQTGKDTIRIDYCGALRHNIFNICSPKGGKTMAAQYSEIQELLRSRAFIA